MFVDLVGSVALSEQLDAEEYLEVLTQYRDVCARHTKNNGGYVARFLGDGMLAYFGYPGASDDDPERAARSALTIVEGVSRLKDKKGDPLAARAGIATGIVVARDIDRHGAEQEHAVTGDIPNLAARLQGAAKPGEVLVSEVTRDLLGSNFSTEQLGELELKGLSRPVKATKLLNVAPARTRFIAKHELEPGPIIGREEEVKQLIDAYRCSISESGRGMLIVAEAGIGKSRLTYELTQNIGDTPRAIFQCAQQYASTPLHPIKNQLHIELGFTGNTPEEVEATEIANFLGLSKLDRGPSQTLLQLLRSPESSDADISISEDERRGALKALSEHYNRISLDKGLVFIIEDIHWIDPSTNSLLELLVESIESSRCFLLATSRPGFDFEWTDNPTIKQINPGNLSNEEAIQLVLQTSSQTELGPELQAQISAQCDGNPLYIEELTRSVIETSNSGSGSNSNRHGFEIPTSLEDTLKTRLDRLGNSKRAVQIGSVFGRYFPEKAISDIEQTDLSSIRQDLVVAENSGILERSFDQAPDTWRFRHALIQESAYQSLLKSDRKQLHNQIAESLIGDVNNEMGFSIIAHHLEFGGDIERASNYWELAGEMDTKRSANVEAVEHLQRATQLLSELEDSERHTARILKINERLIGALRATKGYASSEVGELLDEMLKLSVRAGLDSSKLYTLNGLYSFHLLRSSFEKAGHFAENLLQISIESGNADYQMIAHRATGIVSFYLGDQKLSTSALQESLKRYDKDRHVYLANTYGSDHAETCCSYLSLAKWVVGKTREAVELQNWAVEHSLDISHAHSIAQSRAFRSMLYCLARDWEAVKQDCEDTIIFSEERSLHLMAVWARTTDAIAEANLAPSPANREAMLEAIANLNVLVPNNLQPYLLTEASTAFLDSGDIESARELVLKAEQISVATGEAWANPESMRIRSSLERQLGDTALAEELLTGAIQTAERQGAYLWLLRSAEDRHDFFPSSDSIQVLERARTSVDQTASQR